AEMQYRRGETPRDRLNPARLDAYVERLHGRALLLQNGHDIHRGAGRNRRQQHIKRAGCGVRIPIDAHPGSVLPACLEVEIPDPAHVDRRVSDGCGGWIGHFAGILTPSVAWGQIPQSRLEGIFLEYRASVPR